MEIKEEVTNVLKATERATRLSKQIKKVQILEKYIKCVETSEKRVQRINQLLLNERNIWEKYNPNVISQESVLCWMNETKETFSTLIKNLEKLANTKYILAKLSEKKPLEFYKHLSDILEEIKISIKNEFKKRFSISFALFEWPIENFKLNPKLKMLELKEEENKKSKKSELDFLLKELKFHKIDKRLYLFMILFIYSLKIQKALKFNFENSRKLKKIWMIEELNLPITERFHFHFLNKNSKTNNVEKPEWYFSYCKNQINEHFQFFYYYIQPIIENQVGSIHSLHSFISHQINLIKNKIKIDFPELAENKLLFVHTLLEAAQFTEYIKEIYHFPENLPTPLDVFTDNFKIWLSVEDFGFFFPLFSLFFQYFYSFSFWGEI